MVFLESGIQDKGSRINLKDEGNILYIEKDANLSNVFISLLCKGDFVIFDEGVSVTSTSNWSTGLNSGMENNGLIVGNDCLMASEIAIRPADGHPIIDIKTREQINKSVDPIIIEPYYWIGQRAAILKNVGIGACSVISFGAVVTKSCTRFSVLARIPKKSRSIEGKLWLRNHGDKAMQIQP